MKRVRVKVCGLTRAEDVRAAVEAGADALGFNFYAPSPRSISLEKASELLSFVRPFVESVAVCVEPSLAWIEANLLRLPRLRILQFHGDSPPRPCDVPLPLIPAFRVRSTSEIDAIRAYLDRCGSVPPLAVLVDAHVPGLHGGTGQTAPWHLLAGVDLGVPLVLAGGLTPENVSQAVNQVWPYAVDVASGVENAPGVKDAERMRAFVAASR